MSLNQQEKIQIIQRYPLFNLLKDEDINELALLMSEIQISSNKIIVQEGDAIDTIFLIVEGTAQVTRHSDTRSEKSNLILATLNVGDGIGIDEVGFFSKSGVRTATVTAQTDMKLLTIPLSDFVQFMQDPRRLYASITKSSDIILRSKLIKAIHPFQFRNWEQRRHMIDTVKEIALDENQKLYSAGDPVENCYLLKEGEIKLCQRDTDETIKIVKPFDILGQTVSIDLSYYLNEAVAVKNSKLLSINKKDMTEHSKLFYSIRKSLTANTRLLKDENAQIEQSYFADQPIYILTNSKKENQMLLSAGGWFIWNKLDGNNTIHTIQKIFSETFNKNENDKINDFLSLLIEKNMLKLPASKWWIHLKHFFIKE